MVGCGVERVTVIVASAVLGGSPALSWQAAAQPTTSAEGQSVSAESQAAASAAELGERVEVVAERTERETVFANPDGVTFTLEKSIVPVRVAQPGGGWAAPDATLERRADGSIGPKAATADVTFSLGWPGRLPARRCSSECPPSGPAPCFNPRVRVDAPGLRRRPRPGPGPG